MPVGVMWGDLPTLWQLASKDTENNVLRGEVFTHNSQDLYVHSDDKLVAVLGAKNLVIINTKDGVLVVHKRPYTGH